MLEAVRTEAETYMNEAARGFTSPASFQTAFEEVFGAGRVPRTTSLSGPEGLTYAYLEGMDTGDYTAMRAAYTALTGDEKEKYHMAFLRNSINNLREGLSSGAAFTDPAFAGVDPKHYGVIARAGISAANQFQHIHTYAGRNIRTQENAQVALDAIGRAILRKDANRAQIGALQNRLENTVSNLQIQAENLQAAESRISDVDVAEEMTNFVRSQVLTQAAVAMLAQANSVPNMLLSLVN